MTYDQQMTAIVDMIQRIQPGESWGPIYRLLRAALRTANT